VSSSKKRLIQDDDLLKGLKVSLGLHIALVAAFTIRAAFFTPEKIDYSAAVRVDIVGLPDKAQEQKLPPKQEEAAKPEPVKPEPAPKTPPKEAKVEKPVKAPKKDTEAINLNKEKNKQKEALEKLKAMAAIEEMKKETEKENKKTTSTSDTKAQPTKIKGNVLSPGTALTGLNRLQHDSYLSSLDQQIKQHWYLPEWLSKKPLRAQVRLKIDEKGHILSREIVLSSGNSSYDDLALETIDKSAPFAAPPEKFVSIVAVNGLVIGFPE
jgi:colicin import membrane protein